MHCLVVGVNGVGKSTLLRAVSERMGIPVLHASTEVMRHMGMSLDYDKLRSLDQDYVLEQWEETVKNLVTQYAGKPYLLDGHIMILVEGKARPRDGPWVGRQDGIVLLKAGPETILHRLSLDARDRDLFPEGSSDAEKLAILEHYQTQTEAHFNELVAQYHLPHEIIMIEQLDAAITELEAFIHLNDQPR